MFVGAEAHHALNTSAIVPAAVKDDDFSCRREVPDVALHIHLRFLAFGRRRQRDNTEYARADPLGDRLDRTTFAGAIASLEDNADLQSLADDPLLQLDQLDMQSGEFAFVILALQLPVHRGRTVAAFRFFRLLGCAHDTTSPPSVLKLTL